VAIEANHLSQRKANRAMAANPSRAAGFSKIYAPLLTFRSTPDPSLKGIQSAPSPLQHLFSTARAAGAGPVNSGVRPVVQQVPRSNGAPFSAAKSASRAPPLPAEYRFSHGLNGGIICTNIQPGESTTCKSSAVASPPWDCSSPA
jgi:hypothetical protein